MPNLKTARMASVRPAAGVMLASLALIAADRAQPADAARLYAAYAAGNRTAVRQALDTTERYRALQADLLRLVEAWKTDPSTPAWEAARPAFAVEVALARTLTPAGTGDCARWMQIARDLLAQRPVGTAGRALTAEDRLEVTIHRIAYSVLMTQSAQGSAAFYLDGIGRRLDALARLPDGHSLVARLRLARGMLAETNTRPLATDADRNAAGRRDAQDDGPFAVAPVSAAKEPGLLAAVAVFTTLLSDPDVGAEANVRAAFAWHRLDSQQRALEAVDRALATSRDPVVTYWAQLVRGRILGAMNRLADAAAAYRQAASIVPAAQTPAVALAALSLVEGDRSAAERWAQTARTTVGADVRDPWWLYWFGDARMLDQLVATMREPRS
jgi:tetratricopeptide (TPR) repeat protein